jgi:hypothetical protein
MSAHEATGQSDEWYTPAWIFEAMGVTFDLDVAAPVGSARIPATDWSRAALTMHMPPIGWKGFVWMNPPFGGRNGYRPWAKKFIAHGNGVALAPNRTGAPWWQEFARCCDSLLFVTPKIKFLRPDGSEGKSPGYGSVLMAIGPQGCLALHNAAANGAGLLTTVAQRASQARAA